MAGELLFITGTTGFVGFAVLTKALQTGYRVRIAVRRESQITEIQSHHLIKPFADRGLLEGVVVPDITADGAFDGKLTGANAVLHIASPLPDGSSTDFEASTVQPAVRGTISILNSALKVKSIRRVVITSSVVAIMTDEVLSNGDETSVYTSETRVTPPTGPYDNPWSAYRASKALSLDATDKFLAEKKPQFSIISVMPGYVVGRNEFAKKAEDLLSGSNAVPLSIAVLGIVSPGKRPVIATHIDDVVRVHLESLDETRIPGSRGFVLPAGKDGEKAFLDDVNEIAKKYFPDAVKEGILKADGHTEGAYVTFDKSETTKQFGDLKSYEQAAKDVLGQYVELKKAEAGQ